MREAERIAAALTLVSPYIEASAVEPYGTPAIQLRDPRAASPLEVAGLVRRGRWVTLPAARVRELYAIE